MPIPATRSAVSASPPICEEMMDDADERRHEPDDADAGDALAEERTPEDEYEERRRVHQHGGVPGAGELRALGDALEGQRDHEQPRDRGHGERPAAREPSAGEHDDSEQHRARGERAQHGEDDRRGVLGPDRGGAERRAPEEHGDDEQQIRQPATGVRAAGGHPICLRANGNQRQPDRDPPHRVGDELGRRRQGALQRRPRDGRDERGGGDDAGRAERPQPSQRRHDHRAEHEREQRGRHLQRQRGDEAEERSDEREGEDHQRRERERRATMGAEQPGDRQRVEPADGPEDVAEHRTTDLGPAVDREGARRPPRARRRSPSRRTRSRPPRRC